MAPQRKITPADDELAKAINHELEPYAGRYVGILDGKVVVVCDDLKSVVDGLNEIDPEPRRGLFLEASADYQVPRDRTRFCTATGKV